MKAMEEKILSEGKVLPGGILKVGSFLNQKIDTDFLKETASEIARLYQGCGVNKVLTIESSGIAIAAAVGLEMGVPMVFAKKHKSSNVDGKVFMFRASAEDYKIASTGGQSVKILIQDFHDTNKQLVIEKPTLLFPTFRTERQRAQDGAFYLFPNRVKPVKVIGIKEELYREILIPGTIKGIVKKELEEMYNIHQGVLFPESLSYTSLKLKKDAEDRIRANVCL